MPLALLIVRLVLQSVVAAAMLSLLLGRLAGPWGWVVGAVAGLVMGPFGKLSMKHRSRLKTKDTSEGDEEKDEGNLGTAVVAGCLCGFFASLPLAGVMMLVWFSVAESPWGSGAWSATGVHAVEFSTSDPAMLWTFGAILGGGTLLGAVLIPALFVLAGRHR